MTTKKTRKVRQRPASYETMFTVRSNRDQIQIYQEIAALRGFTLSDLVRHLLAREVEKMEKRS